MDSMLLVSERSEVCSASIFICCSLIILFCSESCWVSAVMEGLFGGEVGGKRGFAQLPMLGMIAALCVVGG